ncbi:ATP-binding protein [Streptomyces umbrinus]|uniref:ATP-binding protein n=1 Tax=Streptomyces umbrinus TaxID=67370 RepID=UPI003C2F2145
MTPTVTIARTNPSTSPRLNVRDGIEVSFARASDSEGDGIAEADQVWPSRVRRIVRTGLRNWGRPDLAESAELLATELVTNALKHGRGDVGVRIYPRADRLRIEVRDGSHECPVPRNATPDDEDGRGLLLVIAIADDWGVSPDGTTTWCTLPF